MSTLTSYNGLEVVPPSPLAGAGGAAINDNFIALSTKIATSENAKRDGKRKAGRVRFPGFRRRKWLRAAERTAGPVP